VSKLRRKVRRGAGTIYPGWARAPPFLASGGARRGTHVGGTPYSTVYSLELVSQTSTVETKQYSRSTRIQQYNYIFTDLLKILKTFCASSNDILNVRIH
jgi:hypothetical protein